MLFDVIMSLPGFNRHALVAEAVPEAGLGSILALFMGLRPESFYEGGTKACAVDVHVHPTYWTNLERMTPEDAIAARPRHLQPEGH